MESGTGERAIAAIGEDVAREVVAEVRSEYRDGVIVEHEVSTVVHSKIAGNALGVFRPGLKGKPYAVFALNQRLWIPDCKLLTYPHYLNGRQGLPKLLL